MNKLFSAAAALALLAAAPASAATYDAFSSFNGTNGNGGFSYGYTDSTALTPFILGFTSGQAGNNCVLGTQSTCLYGSAGVLPQASVGGSYPTVDVPLSAILFHPGNSDSLSVYGAFLAPTAGTYNYSIKLSTVGLDNNTGGIGYTPFTELGGTVSLGNRAVLGAAPPASSYGYSDALSGSQSLAAGQLFGVIVDRNGIYYGDSTSVNFTLSAVPEPATWGLMITGLAMVGFAVRRRRQVVCAPV